jgi:hypothetical protein
MTSMSEKLFGAGHAGAAVVRMDRQDDRLPPVQVVVHVLDLVGVDVRCRDLHRGREVVDDGTVGACVPRRGQAVAGLQYEVRLGEVEHLRGELEPDVVAGAFAGQARHVSGGVADQRVHLGAVTAEDDLTPDGGRGGVQMDDGTRKAVDRGEGPVDEVPTGGGEDDHGDVVGDGSHVGQVADEVEVGSNIRRLRAVSIGSASAWLPSRRSTGTQRGARSMRRPGQDRSVGAISTRSCAGRYRWYGIAPGRWGFQDGASAGTGPEGVRRVGKAVFVTVSPVIGLKSFGRR